MFFIPRTHVILGGQQSPQLKHRAQGDSDQSSKGANICSSLDKVSIKSQQNIKLPYLANTVAIFGLCHQSAISASGDIIPLKEVARDVQ